MVQGVLDAFCDEDGCQFVGASFTLKLTLSLVSVPESYVVLSDIEIKSLGDNRTLRNSPIQGGGLLVLVVTFEEDAGEDGVDLPDVGEVQVVDERDEKEVEMFPANRTCEDIVVGCDIVVVIYFRFHFIQKVK